MLEIDNEKLTKLEGFTAQTSRLFNDCEVFEPDHSLRKFYTV